MKDIQTKDRILDAALRVFAERGFERATISEITRLADANIASVNYYFRSKSDLFREVLIRFFVPLNDARIAAIDACEGPRAAGALDLPMVVAAITAPLVALAREEDHGAAMLRLMLQMRGLPNAELSGFLAEAFDPVHDRVIAALTHVLPHLSRAELVIRYDLARGAMLHTLSDFGQMSRRIGREQGAAVDIGRAVNAFVTGGLSAPV